MMSFVIWKQVFLTLELLKGYVYGIKFGNYEEYLVASTN